MTGFASLDLWDDPALAAALPWYRVVAANQRPAKCRIAATVACGFDPAKADEAALWDAWERLTPVFLERYHAIRREGAALPPPASGPSLLELAVALVRAMLTHCNFCRWDCGVDRAVGTKLGACKLAAETRVGSHFHHQGEEEVYRGTEGSGTIFFTSCNMRCAFCQNGDISTDKDNGVVTDAATLAAIAWRLRMEGCHNINWVGGEATIHLHTIVEAIALLGRGRPPRDQATLRRAAETKADRFAWYQSESARGSYDGAFNAPMLWNSNFFMSPEAMKILRLLIDVWLPDFKFGPGRCSITLARTPRYWETVTGNLALLADWGEDLTIRHLVMPNHVDCCSRPVLDWIARELPGAPVNVMDQYRPDTFCDPWSPKYQARYGEIARRVHESEVAAAISHARGLGLLYESVTYR